MGLVAEDSGDGYVGRDRPTVAGLGAWFGVCSAPPCAKERALVLGGGGVAGIAWETGVLTS